MFLYREEYYNPDSIEHAGVAEVIVAKNRNGPTATTNLSFLPRFAVFKDFAATPKKGVANRPGFTEGAGPVGS